MKKLLLIDTFNFLHRAYHALPSTLSDREGNPTNAVYGVTSMLISVFDALKPDYVVAALDDIEPTFRVGDFTGYKAHRKPMEEGLSSQIPKVFEVLDAFGIKKIALPGYEADDVIGTMVKKFAGEEVEVIIVSNDKDLWQLLKDHVMVMNPNGNGVADWVGEKEVVAKMGFEPWQMVDYKGLRGDPSDNIPGVHGVGDKTAKNLIEVYGSVENIYKNLENIAPVSLKRKLEESYETALMSKKLATIVTDAPVEVELRECKYTTFNKGEVKKVLEKYNFKSLIKRLGFEVSDRKQISRGKSERVNENQLNLI